MSEPHDDDAAIDPVAADHHDRTDAADEQIDADLDRIDDGTDMIGAAAAAAAPAAGGPRSQALPFVMTAREHFASVGELEVTGDARVDAATARLEEIPDLPTSDHVGIYDDVHRRLQDALSDADVR